VNKLFAWMSECGALPQEFAQWDWIKLPARILADEVTDEQIDRARDAVGEFVKRFTKQELMDVAAQRGILMAPAMTIGDLTRSPQLRARGYFETVAESGRLRTLPSRYAAGCEQGFAALRPAPRCGEHDAEVYGELLRLDAAALAQLSREGVIK
jgi:crotonobetainyl-CoA:carnitine CoA-transferase CaiB-like acyl-CoA transferase